MNLAPMPIELLPKRVLARPVLREQILAQVRLVPQPFALVADGVQPLFYPRPAAEDASCVGPEADHVAEDLELCEGLQQDGRVAFAVAFYRGG